MRCLTCSEVSIKKLAHKSFWDKKNFSSNENIDFQDAKRFNWHLNLNPDWISQLIMKNFQWTQKEKGLEMFTLDLKLAIGIHIMLNNSCEYWIHEVFSFLKENEYALLGAIGIFLFCSWVHLTQRFFSKNSKMSKNLDLKLYQFLFQNKETFYQRR